MKGLLKPTPPAKKPEKFNINCKFYPRKSNIWFDAPVLCCINERNYSNKCERCGFNPAVKAKRLEKMCGAKKAAYCIQYSQSINDGTNAEYQRRFRDYKPRREEPEVV